MGDVTTRHLGLDLGATNLKRAVVEHEAGAWHRLATDQQPTRSDGGPSAIVDQMGAAARDAVDRWGPIATVGVGVPGLYDPAAGTTRFIPNIDGEWMGRAVAGPISAEVGLPVALINDARACALAELRLGAGRGCGSMIALTLGTGVGGGIVIDGRLHQGHDGTAGELGHQTLEPEGLPCTCGNLGCMEAYARADRITGLCGTDTVEAAVAAARGGDARAAAGLAEVGRWLGVGIANAVVVLTPDRVVLGGGVSAAGDLLLGPIREQLRRRVRVTALDEVQVVTAELGTWAGAIGAAVHGAERAGVVPPPDRPGQTDGPGPGSTGPATARTTA